MSIQVFLRVQYKFSPWNMLSPLMVYQFTIAFTPFLEPILFLHDFCTRIFDKEIEIAMAKEMKRLNAEHGRSGYHWMRPPYMKTIDYLAYLFGRSVFQ